MIVNLHIDRLVIDGPGLGPNDGARIEAAVAAELRRRLGTLASAEAFAAGAPLIRAGTIAPSADPERLGAQIGGAISGSLAR